MKRRPTPHRGDQLAWLAGIVVLVVYFGTAARDIIFGDGMELCAVAATGGVPHPPGYPFYTLLAQAVLAIAPRAHAYAALACMNAFLGAATALLFGLMVERILREEKGALPDAIRVWLPACAVLVAAFSRSLWSASTVVEVYALNALLTLVFHRAVGTDVGSGGARRLAVAGVAIGLIASNHLPGLAILPLLLARLIQARGGRRGMRAAMIGLACAIMIPVMFAASLVARTAGDREGIFWGEPRSLGGLVAHLRGGEYGQFQLMQERPGVPFRPATWLSFAAGRVAVMASDLDGQFGPGIPLVPGLLVVGCAILGVVRLRRCDSVLAWAACAGGGLQVAFLLVYNIPDFADYELGIAAAMAPLFAHGLVEAATRLARVTGYAEVPARTVRLALLPVAVALLGFAGNFGACSMNREDFPRKWLSRVLEALPPDAMLVTHGDADTYAMWYAQHVERTRRDVTVYGANFHRFAWFARTIPREARLRGVVAFEDGPPPDFAGFLREIERLAIAPAAGKTRIFTTLPDEPTYRAWAARHELQRSAVLASEAELMSYAARNPRGFVSPILLEILPHRTP